MQTTPALPPAASPPPFTALEQVVGEIAADAAVALARALREFQTDGLSARETRMHVGDLIARAPGRSIFTPRREPVAPACYRNATARTSTRERSPC